MNVGMNSAEFGFMVIALAELIEERSLRVSEVCSTSEKLSLSSLLLERVLRLGVRKVYVSGFSS